MSGVRDIVFIVGIALLPLCSIQHFIWPLSWCLLADVSNHTWIPECGYDELLDSYRVFIDECDMFEYNCDHETDYEVTNYSLCFGGGANVICRKPKPCPSRPTCPDHRYHRMGDRFVYFDGRRQGRRMNDLGGSTLPMKMLSGKRRYTPEKKKRMNRRNRDGTPYVPRTRRTTISRTRPRGPPTKHIWTKQTTETLETTTETVKENEVTSTSKESTTTGKTKLKVHTAVIVRRETIKKNGKIYVKIVKRVKKYGYEDNKIEDPDFLE